jgi:hypothetical protein
MHASQALMLVAAIAFCFAHLCGAEESSDEVALKRPLPTLAAPESPTEPSTFSTEAPPPPAFDPSYKPPLTNPEKETP